MKKIILAFVSIAVIGLILLLLDFAEKDSPLKMKLSMEGSVFKDVEFIQRKQGQLTVKLTAKESIMSDDGKKMELAYITMFFPEKNFTVKAKKGFYYTESGDLILTDGIEGVSKDYKVSGTEASWNAKDRTLYSEKPLRIEGEKFVIEGNSGKATSDLIELKKGVKAIVYSKR